MWGRRSHWVTWDGWKSAAWTHHSCTFVLLHPEYKPWQRILTHSDALRTRIAMANSDHHYHLQSALFPQSYSISWFLLQVAWQDSSSLWLMRKRKETDYLLLGLREDWWTPWSRANLPWQWTICGSRKQLQASFIPQQKPSQRTNFAFSGPLGKVFLSSCFYTVKMPSTQKRRSAKSSTFWHGWRHNKGGHYQGMNPFCMAAL